MASTTPPLLPATGAPSAAVLDDAIARLSRGEVVGLPAETVYSLAVRADDPEALARLIALTGHELGSPTGPIWHVADAEVVQSAALPHYVGRAAARYWPGPLALWLQGLIQARDPEASDPIVGGTPAPRALAHEGWLGVRVPGHAGTRAVLAQAPFPVAMVPATRADRGSGHDAEGTRASADEPGAIDASAVRGAFSAAEVPLVLDGGPAQLAQSATIAALGPGRFEVLREGILSAADLRRATGLSIVFVCTGNTCRSAMAEGLARVALARALGVPAGEIARFGFSVESAGVHAGLGAPASAQSIEVLAGRGIDLGEHASTPVRVRELLAADRVYCATESHRALLLDALPPGKGSHVALIDPDGQDVPDPYGGPVADYITTADALTTFIARRLAEDWI